ncbi:vWA domain-containing protein [Deinococcus roseus]|uniref:VWFA domain-containing protein n=1 Tax=Deinococcus roseus TaxID=392414 RepID=A0ABQ2DF90_9DEIO|nr:vWA domain-containing protein [Deinococcus roseus]GGJ53624.1 hypothetical protein GCM10008938_44570 [Deinococcus roseus]
MMIQPVKTAKHHAMLALCTLGLLLSACGPTTAVVTPPKTGTVNGYTIDAAHKDTVKFNISALDGAGKVILSGKVDSFTVQVSEVTGNPDSNNPQDFTYTASICGQYTSAGGPLTCAVVLDASGSMGSTDPEKKRKEAAQQFVARTTSSDQVAVANFGAGGQDPYDDLHVYQTFTSDKTLLNTAIADATRASGGTPLWEATDQATDLLSKATGKNKIALVLTDGNANGGMDVDTAIAAAQKANVKLFMVGLDANGIDEADMQKAATMTGGLYSKVSEAAGLKDLFDKAFNQSQAYACLQVVFKVKGKLPAAGTEIKGTLTVNMNGGQFVAPYAVTFL